MRHLDPRGIFSTRQLDRDARDVVRRLNRFGFDAYFVGGCVRDLLVGMQPKDFDIATSATPRQVKRLFRNSRIIGRRFRLAHVAFRDKILEVSTFRAAAGEAGVTDESDPMIRHDNVFGTAREDAWRRDFTVNGLFFDLQEGEVIDYVGGLEDLRRRVIKTIGDPWIRFREDPVRMMRAIKFAGRLEFDLEDGTYLAMLDCKDDLKKAAAPRVLDEIVRLMNRGGGRRSIELLYQTGLMRVILPEIADCIDRAFLSASELPLFDQLDQIDQRVRAGRRVDQSLMMAYLLLPVCEDAVYGEDGAEPLPGREFKARLERDLRPVMRRMHLSRRESHRVEELLDLQRGFLGKPRRTKRFIARPQFRDAWRFFRIYGETTGRFAEERAEWTERLRRPSPR